MDAAIPSPEVLDVAERRRGAAIRAGAFAVLAALAALMTTGEDETVSVRLAFAAAAAGFALGLGLAVWHLVRPRVALTLDAVGFVAPRHFVSRIAWRGVAHVTPVLTGDGSHLIVALRPETSTMARPSLRRRLALLLRLADRERLVIDLDRLTVAPSRVVAYVEERVRAKRYAGDDSPIVVDLPDALAAREDIPYFTMGFIAAMVAIYGLEAAFAFHPPSWAEIDTDTLLAFGGTVHSLILDYNQVWRLVTATLLHGGVLHILFNMYALAVAAVLLESRIGWRWFAATFALSAFGGSIFSILLNKPGIVGIGASGGILGLSAATAAVGFHYPRGPVRSRLLGGALGILVPSLLPSLSGTTGGGTTDIAAHLGGTVFGSATGLAILLLWPRTAREPRFGRVALAVAAAFFFVAVVSIPPIHKSYRAVGMLAPSFPSDVKLAKARSAALLQSYPRDPRVRYMHALVLLGQNDLVGARSDLQTALDDRAMLVATVKNLDPFIRGLLALVMVEQGKTPDAAHLLEDHCPAVLAIYHDDITKKGLCSTTPVATSAGKAPGKQGGKPDGPDTVDPPGADAVATATRPQTTSKPAAP